MTIREAKNEGIYKLRRFDDETVIDAEILLSHCLGISREEMLAHDKRRIPPFALQRFRALIARRKKHEPIAYLVGHREFFGLQFEVNKHTLIPRPETELLVEEVLARTPPTPSFQEGAEYYPSLEKGGSGRVLVIDVGTGSGAIAVALAKNSNATIIATDASKAALKIAERNAVMNNVEDRIDFRRADLLFDLVSKMKRSLHFRDSIIIIANLPYIPTADWRRCMPDVKNFEPRAALDGGSDGLRLYDRLLHQISAIHTRSAVRGSSRREHAPAGRLNFSQAAGDAHDDRGTVTLICEIDPSQKKSFPRLVKKHFPEARVEIKNDLAGRPRVGIFNL